ncbi:MAG: hypothetical protein K6C69_03970 [Lachnospiraceae bacterium]|nr:hypothetical protein [Lachnospiraceae bacterium]
MKFLFPFVFFSAIAFSAYVKRNAKNDLDITMEILNKEREANTTRRQDISNLDYIHLDPDRLPVLTAPSSKLADYDQKLRGYVDKKMLNLSGISNTELKLTYGAPNLPILSEYDEAFTQCSILLNKYGQTLMEEGFSREAVELLNYTLELGAASSQSILLLGKEYQRTGNTSALDQLLLHASSLPDSIRELTIQKLRDL